VSEVVRIGNAELWLADCREIMPTLRTVDAVITDPPYMNMEGGTRLPDGSGVAKCRNVSITVADPWDANLEWLLPAWNLAERAFFSFCSFHFLSELRQTIPAKPTALISWYQRNAAPSAAMAPQFQTEYCWAFRKATGLNWRKLKTHIDIPRLQAGCMATERIVETNGTVSHPAQKPVKLMEELLKIGVTSVLDPFMGVGTTGVACANLGRAFVGIEIDERYFQLACERIERAQRQSVLFPPEPMKAHEQMLLEEA